MRLFDLAKNMMRSPEIQKNDYYRTLSKVGITAVCPCRVFGQEPKGCPPIECKSHWQRNSKKYFCEVAGR